MRLKDLEGIKILSGIERGYSPEIYVLFRLDNITYLAEEDPDDGYRSCCKTIKVVSQLPKTTFKQIEVLCKMRDSAEGTVLEILNKETGNMIMAIGTDREDYHYPYFVFEYQPENITY